MQVCVPERERTLIGMQMNFALKNFTLLGLPHLVVIFTEALNVSLQRSKLKALYSCKEKNKKSQASCSGTHL